MDFTNDLFLRRVLSWTSRYTETVGDCADSQEPLMRAGILRGFGRNVARTTFISGSVTSTQVRFGLSEVVFICSS